VPKKWNVSRFLKVLGTEPHRTLLREVFDAMVRRLGEAAADLGRHTAGDSSGLSARDEARPDPSLPRPAGGRKVYTDETGAVTKVVEWFGYKFHLLVDTQHEVAVAYRVFAFLGTVLVVHAGLATLPASAPRREGTLGQMHVGAVQKALREKLAT